jgi:hypothetical protein
MDDDDDGHAPYPVQQCGEGSERRLAQFDLNLGLPVPVTPGLSPLIHNLTETFFSVSIFIYSIKISFWRQIKKKFRSPIPS